MYTVPKDKLLSTTEMAPVIRAWVLAVAQTEVAALSQATACTGQQRTRGCEGMQAWVVLCIPYHTVGRGCGEPCSEHKTHNKEENEEAEVALEPAG